jgi:MFS family permease
MTPASASDPREQSRKVALREGAFFATMQGAGENYLSAFALLLHATTVQIGLLSALPQLIGTWAQLVAVNALTRIGRRNVIISVGAGGQALMWLPLLSFPLLFPSEAGWILIACAIVYFAMGHFAVPAWISLMADFIDPDGRGLYFSRRHRIIAVVSFLALCGAGLILHLAALVDAPVIGFVIIFLGAAAARTASTVLLGRLDESVTVRTREAPFRLLAFLRHEEGGNFRWFMVFSCLMHVSVMIAGPYFVVYMLRDLHFSYLEYTAWLASQLFGQLISLQRWGKIGDRFGNKKVLAVTSLTVPIIPMLYLVSANLYFLMLVSFWGGVIWAGLALALQNYVFDVVAPEDRGKSVALMNTVNAIGWFIGALIGSGLAAVLPSTLRLGSVTFSLASSLPLVFALSGLLRLTVAVLLLKMFREGRRVEPISARQLLIHLPVIKPLSQAFGRAQRLL